MSDHQETLQEALVLIDYGLSQLHGVNFIESPKMTDLLLDVRALVMAASLENHDAAVS